MPIVMPVVVSQAAGANQAHRDLEEKLVTRLMLDEAADVRLIGPMQQLQGNSTDQVMLERITSDFILLGWHAPEESLRNLQALGIAARRAAHAGDRNPPLRSCRGVYFIDLTKLKSIDDAILQIKACSANRANKTIQIGLSAPSPKKSAPPVPPSSPPPTSQPASPAAESPSTAERYVALGRNDHRDEPHDAVDDAMESLIDELDQMDL
ncbi:hypothetical protein [Rosistilla oblonga]|uniref:hypothetical protein n=1 Tax=Rosistilla oblonga TaxID=2527990 RepID=UPI003A96A1E9